MIGEIKANISVEELCEGLPDEFAIYFNYVRSLKFGSKPKYAHLRRLFGRLFRREGFKYDNVYDWTAKLFSEMQKDTSSIPITNSAPREDDDVADGEKEADQEETEGNDDEMEDNAEEEEKKAA